MNEQDKEILEVINELINISEKIILYCKGLDTLTYEQLMQICKYKSVPELKRANELIERLKAQSQQKQSLGVKND